MRQQFLRITGVFCLLLLAMTATAGTWSANRFFYQPNVDARGTAEKANFDTGINRVDAHLATEKTLGDPGYETLAAALTTIGSSKVTLTIPAGTVAISSNTTIGTNIALKILNGGVFSISGGTTLTINGPIDAGPYQIFSGTGTASLGGVSTIYDVWYASPPSNPGNIAAPVGCRFVKTAGSTPIVYNKESGTGTTGWNASSGGGSSTFTGLTDAPSSYTGQAGKALRVNAGATALEFFTAGSGGTSVFTGLTDVPGTYTGQAGKALRVNPGASALEFFTPFSGVFTNLADAPTSYTGQAGKALRVNSTANGLEFFTPPLSGASIFTGLTDVPGTYTGQAGKALRVNPGASGLEFFTPFSGAFTNLNDAPTSYTGQAGKSLRVNSSANGLEFYTPISGGVSVFTGLTDVPTSYTGQAGKSIRVNSSANGLEFYTSSSSGTKPYNTLGDVGYTTIAEALATINTTEATLVIPAGAGTLPITSNTTIPANVHLQVVRGANFQVANGVTLSIEGPIEAGPYKIFSCTGTGAVDLSRQPHPRFLHSLVGSAGRDSQRLHRRFQQCRYRRWIVLVQEHQTDPRGLEDQPPPFMSARCLVLALLAMAWITPASISTWAWPAMVSFSVILHPWNASTG